MRHRWIRLNQSESVQKCSKESQKYFRDLQRSSEIVRCSELLVSLDCLWWVAEMSEQSVKPAGMLRVYFHDHTQLEAVCRTNLTADISWLSPWFLSWELVGRRGAIRLIVTSFSQLWDLHIRFTKLFKDPLTWQKWFNLVKRCNKVCGLSLGATCRIWSCNASWQPRYKTLHLTQDSSVQDTSFTVDSESLHRRISAPCFID